MNKDKVFSKVKFADEATGLFKLAGEIAYKLHEPMILCSHLFVACVLSEPEVVHRLLGREITALPEKFKLNPSRKSCDAGWHGRDFDPEVVSLFIGATAGDPVQMLREYLNDREFGVPEIAFLLMMDPTEEISDILLANGFPNNLAAVNNILMANYLSNVIDFSPVPPKERLNKPLHDIEIFKKFMRSRIHGQDKAISDVAECLTEFWHRGNGSLPLVIFLLSKSGGGRSFFAETMQRAFIEIGLQTKYEPPIDMSGFLHDSSCEADLLGDARSFRNSRNGILFRMSSGNRRGMMVFEDISGCNRNARNILLSLTKNLAFDKYEEKSIYLPMNVVVFTMMIADEQYRFIKEKATRDVDAPLLNSLFLSSGEKNSMFKLNSAAAEASGIWQRADKIILLEQLSESQLRKITMDRLNSLSKRFKDDYDITMSCNDYERLLDMVMLSSPNEFVPRTVFRALDETIQKKTLLHDMTHNRSIKEFVIECPELPVYQHDSSRRIIRGDYLSFQPESAMEGDVLKLSFSNLRYKQQERIDCADFRIERPKGTDFRDLVGLDEVRDELLDALYYIENIDKLHGKVPEPCLNYILYGPPGTGKTSIAVALANSADIPVFFATSSLFSNPRNISDMFRMANEMAPAIVVMEEFNSIGKSDNAWRRDAINELLSILDGAQENGKLLVIASTNHIEHIEEALLRSGRFGRLIKVGYPTAESRLAFVRKFEHKYDFKLPDNVVNEFVASTENVSIADIKGMLGYALRTSIRLHRPFDAACMHDVLRKFRHDSVKEGIGFIGRD